MIECLKNYGWKFMTLYGRQRSRPSPRGKKKISKKAKWLSEVDLKIADKKKRKRKKQRRKRKIYLFECRI